MNSESVWSDAAYSMSWPAFQPKARTEKLSRPSLMLGFRAAGEEAASAGAPGKTASPATAAAVDRRKARREVWEQVDFIVGWWSSRVPLALPTGMKRIGERKLVWKSGFYRPVWCLSLSGFAPVTSKVECWS